MGKDAGKRTPDTAGREPAGGISTNDSGIALIRNGTVLHTFRHCWWDSILDTCWKMAPCRFDKEIPVQKGEALSPFTTRVMPRAAPGGRPVTRKTTWFSLSSCGKKEGCGEEGERGGYGLEQGEHGKNRVPLTSPW